MRQKPTVLAREIVASSRLFRVEELQLRFSSGVERTYERAGRQGQRLRAVMIVALADAENALLVEVLRRYRQLSCRCQGLIEPGEDVLEAANRELKEEAGFGARRLELLTELSLSPGYEARRSRWYWRAISTGAGAARRRAESMRLEQVSLHGLSSLVQHPQFSEGARSPRCIWRGIFSPSVGSSANESSLPVGVIDLVRQAGEAILPHWRSELEVQAKADASPVTAADMAAHHVLLDGLQALDGSIRCFPKKIARCRWPSARRLDALVAGRPAGRRKEFIAGSDSPSTWR